MKMKWVHLEETYAWLPLREEPTNGIEKRFCTQYGHVPSALVEQLEIAEAAQRSASEAIDEWLKANNPCFNGKHDCEHCVSRRRA